MALRHPTATRPGSRLVALRPFLLPIVAIVLIGTMSAVFGNQTPAPTWDLTMDPAAALPF